MQKFWIVLVVLSGGAVLWFGGLALSELWSYVRLGEETVGKVQEWSVVQKGSSYLLQAKYSYEVDGKMYEGTTLFKQPKYLNRPSAEKAIQERNQVWYRKQNPSLSSMEHRFPYKNIVRFCFSLGIFIYFFFFKSYLDTLSKSM